MLLVTVAMVEPGVIFCLNLGGNQGIHPFGNKALIFLPMAKSSSTWEHVVLVWFVQTWATISLPTLVVYTWNRLPHDWLFPAWCHALADSGPSLPPMHCCHVPPKFDLCLHVFQSAAVSSRPLLHYSTITTCWPLWDSDFPTMSCCCSWHTQTSPFPATTLLKSVGR